MEITLKEKSLNVEVKEVEQIIETTPFTELDERLKLALNCASDKKAFEMTAIDLRSIADFTDFFLIFTGANTRQVQAISDEIEEQLKKQLKERVLRIEGHNTAEWILMDYGDFVVHIFEKDARKFYNLERLWRDAKRVELPAELTQS